MFCFGPWSRKTAWIRALVSHAYKICNQESLLKTELETITKFMSWNGFSRSLSKKLIDACTPFSSPPNQTDINTDPTDATAKIWIHLLSSENSEPD